MSVVIIDAHIVFSESGLHELRVTWQQCALARERIAHASTLLSELNLQYDAVSSRTSSLHTGLEMHFVVLLLFIYISACDALMADQTRLATTANDLRTQLIYYEHVEPIMQVLCVMEMNFGVFRNCCHRICL